MHPAPGFVQQFTSTNHGGVDGSPSISSTGVVFCILEQVEALGRRDPALVGEAPSFLPGPGSPKVTSVPELPGLGSYCGERF